MMAANDEKPVSGKRTGDLAMTEDEIKMLREVYECSGSSLVEASKALGVNRETFMRAMAGLPLLAMTSQYLRLALTRTLENMRRKRRSQRTG